MSEQDKGLEASRSQPCADASALALKACPFCGGPGEFAPHGEIVGMIIAGCADGGCAGHAVAYDFVTKQYAADHWNGRASPVSVIKEIQTQVYALCEDMSEEAFTNLGRVDLDDHSTGYYRGLKYAAKATARAMGEVFREMLSDGGEAVQLGNSGMKKDSSHDQ